MREARNQTRGTQTYRETERQAEREPDVKTETKTARQRDRETERQGDRETDRQTGRQTGRQAERGHSKEQVLDPNVLPRPMFIRFTVLSCKVSCERASMCVWSDVVHDRKP